MNIIDNTKNNDGNNDNKAIIMILITKMITILIMITVTQNNWNGNCINKTNLLACQLMINKILHSH